ncbi:unnamed protein product, partial [Effrenium voratum]
ELETAEKSIESSKQDVKKELESLRGRARPSLEKALAESQKKADSAKRSQSEAAARLKSWETQQKDLVAKGKANEEKLKSELAKAQSEPARAFRRRAWGACAWGAGAVFVIDLRSPGLQPGYILT